VNRRFSHKSRREKAKGGKAKDQTNTNIMKNIMKSSRRKTTDTNACDDLFSSFVVHLPLFGVRKDLGQGGGEGEG
jgi:hypothetical protein